MSESRSRKLRKLVGSLNFPRKQFKAKNRIAKKLWVQGYSEAEIIKRLI